MKATPVLLLLSLMLVSCSGSKSANKVSEETPQVELSDADEFIDNAEEPAVAASEEPAAVQEVLAEVDEEPMTENNEVMEEPVIEETVALAEAPVVTSKRSASAGTKMEYKVLKNETLMLIAFKIYGDYDKWKELASQNRDKLKGATSLKPGTVLSYTSPAQEFVWNPQGLPYLIRTGDTLGVISKSVYQTPKKWKMLWENNRPLIKDPNRIFAGFTLYYLENGRQVASEI